MITIISDDSDQTTSNVIDWLLYYNKKFRRINSDNQWLLNNISLNLNDCGFLTNVAGTNYEIKSMFNSIWFRRGEFLFKSRDIKNVNGLDCVQQIERHLKHESNKIIDYLYWLIRKNAKFSLNSIEDYSINKLHVLSVANSLGLDIPDTIITSYKRDLLRFYSKHSINGIITKPISECLSFRENNYSYKMYTKEVECIEDMSEEFFPSLFQEKINKQFEIRTFYLNEKFYSMAIFSQNSNKTKIDYRNYDKENPNRTVPYLLTKEVESKLRALMKKLKINSGSIDLIYSIKGEVVFLELNPVGQLGMLSFTCNYYLEKRIAKIL